ncbi:MAG TPA: 50S ribosomal protein L24 [Candidatus Limnocylindrales bacterium]|nr:50S ribosomal protein L24 [Candidatus Limnocylindrales bacterium]
MSVRRGDRVLVLSGKDKGKKGKVIATLPRKGRIKVEGINIVKKHAKPTQRIPQGGIREMEAAFPASKVMVVCPACSKPTRIAKKILPDKRRVRTCKKCGESLDK